MMDAYRPNSTVGVSVSSSSMKLERPFESFIFHEFSKKVINRSCDIQ